MTGYPWLPPAAHPAALQPRQAIFHGLDISEHHPTTKNAPAAVLKASTIERLPR